MLSIGDDRRVRKHAAVVAATSSDCRLPSAGVDVLLPALDGRFGDHDAALRVGDESVEWEVLRRRAHRVAADIVGRGVVAIEATPTLDTVIGVVAALAAGVAVVPIPSDAGPLERSHILRDSGATAVLGSPSWDDVALPSVPLAGESGSTELAEPSPEAAALIVYTSGTTGPPKGAVLSRRALAADLDGLADAWAWTPDDHLVHGLPLFHVHGLVLGVLGPLRVGSRLTHTGAPRTGGVRRGRWHLATSVCRRCGRGSVPNRLRHERSVRLGSWCRAAHRCRCRCSTSSSSSPAEHRWSDTG